jgi:hypothetical protein
LMGSERQWSKPSTTPGAGVTELSVVVTIPQSLCSAKTSLAWRANPPHLVLGSGIAQGRGIHVNVVLAAEFVHLVNDFVGNGSQDKPVTLHATKP